MSISLTNSSEFSEVLYLDTAKFIKLVHNSFITFKGQIYFNEKHQSIDPLHDDDQYAYLCTTYIKR